MPRPRDRQTATGLLPRMEARPRKDGLTTYRYHPQQPDGTRGKPINLGTDKAPRFSLADPVQTANAAQAGIDHLQTFGERG